MKRLAMGLAVLVPALVASHGSRAASVGMDWPLFGYDAARHDSAPAAGITAANAGMLRRRAVRVDGTVDSSAIYLHGVGVHGSKHDVFFFTTTYGRTEAMDAATGRVLWRFTPPSYAAVAGSARITNSTPAASSDRTAVYASAPDGRLRKLRVSDGKVLWTAVLTRDPTHEKLTSSINVSRGMVLMTTGGYIGDAPPYQGHVVTLSEKTGRILHVWNALCSNRHALLVPSTCGASDAAIWSRNGAAVDPSNGDLVVATGNGSWNGSTNWGDSVLVLTSTGSRLLRHYTPADYDRLDSADLDLGSTSPALLPNGYAVQGGKDGILRLLDLHRMRARTGGELQRLPLPGSTDLFSEPAVWNGRWVFVANAAGTEALLFRGGRLHPVWSNRAGGTSPVVSGSLLFVAGSGAVRVYVATSGRLVATLPSGQAHWQSPIVADGRVAVAEGDANAHATTGVFDIYSLR
ncbi:MAG TPA: PQQ-binding-like beta-propeller repeat protein [Gaiellaceae bacterium]|nr:PQQ-binding-like beta-propeller repeat protein [Gaiellaceae bacterium]